ncbi:hypothetical protein H632_c216p1 [Helicosporidium sp. ATCC 50920]|nr:hypothetical protein H632_c216p1 [Helicosporidium sp. ATCC 50920]|eukprot:KDD76463.1 hypothetical protein H632_c216p1 [Helicosporidium sp. ATCC 50920]
MASDSKLRVGDRLVVASAYKCTLRYIGGLHGQEGAWAGVEWDDPGRGKHRGEHEGRSYFDCSTPRPAQPASFVRLSKLESACEVGCSLLDAVREKYAGRDFAPKPEGYVFVGEGEAETRLAHLDALESISVAGAHVGSVDAPDVLTPALGSTEELDLTQTALGSWEDVERLGRGLPRLTVLNASHISGLRHAPPPRLGSHFPRLRVLALNGTGVDLAAATTLFGAARCIQELRLVGNGVRELGTSWRGGESGGAWSSLAILDLQNNALESWTDVEEALGDLPALRKLLLGGNPLTVISVASRDRFRRLESLQVSGCKLRDWDSVDQLHRLTSLRELRIADNELPAPVTGDVRCELIARVGRIVVLNGGLIAPGERKDAELFYLRRVTDAAAERGLDELAPEIAREHPRMAELVERYGRLAAPKSETAASTRTMIQLTLRCGDATVEKKLPSSLTVARLKPLLARLLGVDVSGRHITLLPSGAPDSHGGERIQDRDQLSLHVLGAAQGSVVRVEEAGGVELGSREAQEREEEQEEALQALHTEQRKIMLQV